MIRLTEGIGYISLRIMSLTITNSDLVVLKIISKIFLFSCSYLVFILCSFGYYCHVIIKILALWKATDEKVD